MRSLRAKYLKVRWIFYPVDASAYSLKACVTKFWIKVGKSSGPHYLEKGKRTFPPPPTSPQEKKGAAGNQTVEVANSHRTRKGEALDEMNLEKCWLIRETEVGEYHGEVTPPPPRNRIWRVHKTPAVLTRILRGCKGGIVYSEFFPVSDPGVVKTAAVGTRG